MMGALRLVVAIGLAALIGISLLPVLGPWPGDMVAPFRIQLLIAAAVGLVVTLVLRRRWLIGFAVVVMAVNLLPMLVRINDRPILPETATGQTISLVFANVLFDNRDFDRAIALARSEDSDIFAAAETTDEWVAALNGLKDIYPHAFAPTGIGPFGVALYAKRPFAGTVERVGARGMPLLRADFGDMVLYVAHPMPPASAPLEADNREYLATLAERVSVEVLPVVVAGDFNSTLWSANIEPLLRLKMQWPTGSGMGYSWPAGRAWMAIQIDQVLTLGMKAGRYSVRGDIGSDHYPVRADLVM